jgi:hypothetical protein
VPGQSTVRVDARMGSNVAAGPPTLRHSTIPQLLWSGPEKSRLARIGTSPDFGPETGTSGLCNTVGGPGSSNRTSLMVDSPSKSNTQARIDNQS